MIFCWDTWRPGPLRHCSLISIKPRPPWYIPVNKTTPSSGLRKIPSNYYTSFKEGGTSLYPLDLTAPMMIRKIRLHQDQWQIHAWFQNLEIRRYKQVQQPTKKTWLKSFLATLRKSGPYTWKIFEAAITCGSLPLNCYLSKKKPISKTYLNNWLIIFVLVFIWMII